MGPVERLVKRKVANQIAQIILDQMGGQRRLVAMIGAHTFVSHPKGVSFKFPRPASGKPNYVKVTLAGDDTYQMEFGSIHGLTYKKLKVLPGVYNDMLGETFKKMTGLHLRLAQETPMNLTPQEYQRLLMAGTEKTLFASSKVAAGKTVRLKTKAETVWTRSLNKPVEKYTVALVEDPRYFDDQGLSLHIEGTPGKWPLGDLWTRGHAPQGLWIDMGQGWEWVNTTEVFREIEKLVVPRQGYQFK